MSTHHQDQVMETCPQHKVVSGASVARKLLAALELVAAGLFAAILAMMALRRRRTEPIRNLRGCSVLVTDGNNVFGRAIASRFAEQGCKVARIERPSSNINNSNEIAMHCNNSNCDCPLKFVCEIRDPSQMAQLAISIKERLGKIDILICQTTIKEIDGPTENGIDNIARLVDEELKMHLYLLQNFVPLVEKESGHVVVIPGDTKHSHIFRNTREALVDLMFTLTDQLTKSNGITVTCARFHNSSKDINDAAARLIEAIQRKLKYCDLSCNTFWETLQTTVQNISKTFLFNLKKRRLGVGEK